jgi:hypothetical protein
MCAIKWIIATAILAIALPLSVAAQTRSQIQDWAPSRPSEDLMCTQIGCVDGLTLKVFPTHRWQPGDYLFEFELEGEKLSCKGQLPFRSCLEARNVQCSSERVRIVQTGCALPPAEHGFGNITIADGPRQIRIKIKRNDKITMERSLTPRYTILTPNGPECPPRCRQSTVKLY